MELALTKKVKKGVAIDGLVQEWLSQTLMEGKLKADLEILKQRKHDFEGSIRIILIGTKINQQERGINVTNSLIYKFSMP